MEYQNVSGLCNHFYLWISFSITEWCLKHIITIENFVVFIWIEFFSNYFFFTWMYMLASSRLMSGKEEQLMKICFLSRCRYSVFFLVVVSEPCLIPQHLLEQDASRRKALALNSRMCFTYHRQIKKKGFLWLGEWNPDLIEVSAKTVSWLL